MSEAERIAAAVMKRVKSNFSFREGRDYSLRHRLSVPTLPYEVYVEACRLIEEETRQLMRARGCTDGRLVVDYGDGCRSAYLGCGFMVRVISAQNVRPRAWPVPRRHRAI